MSLTLKARTKIFLLFVIIVMGVLAAFNFAIFSIVEKDWQDKKMALMKTDMYAMYTKDQAKMKLKDVYISAPDGSVEFKSGIFESMASVSDIPQGDIQKFADRYYSIVSEKLPDGSMLAVADDVTDVIGTKFDLVEKARILSVAALAVVAVLAFFFTWYLFRPIREITRKAEAFDPHRSFEEVRIGLCGDKKDEFVMLADSMDTLFARLIRDTGKLEQFSDDLAHELKNRLFEIRSTLELGLHKKSYEKTIARVLDETSALWELVDKLLLFARLENTELFREKSDLRTLIVSLFGEESSRLAISPKKTVVWNVSPELFATALFNLIWNALKYSDPKSTVNIRLTPSKIEISDHWPGIAPENLPYIFDRFYKVDVSRAHGSGHGLGLSVAKKIIEAHGLDLRIESVVGKGTKVTIEKVV